MHSDGIQAVKTFQAPSKHCTVQNYLSLSPELSQDVEGAHQGDLPVQWLEVRAHICSTILPSDSNNALHERRRTRHWELGDMQPSKRVIPVSCLCNFASLFGAKQHKEGLRFHHRLHAKGSRIRENSLEDQHTGAAGTADIEHGTVVALN